MANERWDSPFSCTLALNLFRKHFTELNKVYWAFVPASNTIFSHAKKALGSDGADPKTFFLVHDEDDRRVAPTFGEWKTNYKEYTNYTRLNMIMLLSSCFETYMRTAISNAFESKPGVIIMCAESVDGVFLLKNKPGYGNVTDKNYQFADLVDEICRGEWRKRLTVFEKYFGKPPKPILEKITELDELRNTRNNIGHYIGRPKKDYSAPAILSPMSAIRVSHDRILKYFKLVNDVVYAFDKYLKKNYIGSYDIIKFYFDQVTQGNITSDAPGMRARELQKLLGNEGFPPAGNEYYRNIISYCDLDSQDDLCMYSRKACLKEINRQLTLHGTPLVFSGRRVRFNNYHFNLFIRTNDWKTNPEYCQQNLANKKQIEYRYSEKLISEIVTAISNCPENIIEDLQKRE